MRRDIFIKWDAIDGSSVTQEEIDTAFAQTKKRAARLEKEARQHRIGLWRVVAVSAVAAAVALGAVVGIRISAPQAALGQFEIVADCGQRSDMLLPDGSHIRLNSASRVSFSTEYGKTNRNISLEGEAFFEVAKNAELPFIVSTGNISVEALGTKFNVRSYEDGDETVTLVDGKVLTTAGTSEAVLYPHHSISYNRSLGTLGQPQPTEIGSEVPWLRNEVAFNGSSLTAVATEMERLFNVRVILTDESIKTLRYTGVIPNTSLKAMLNLITETSPVCWTIDGNVVKLSRLNR